MRKQNSNTTKDACRSDCRKAYCGDKVVDTGEECDGSDNCTEECQRVHFAATMSGKFAGVGVVVLVGLIAALINALMRSPRGGGGAGGTPAPDPSSPGRSPKHEGPISLDDIPLSELEMPWHRWEE